MLSQSYRQVPAGTMNVISQIRLTLPLIYFFIGHSATEKQYLPSPRNVTVGIMGEPAWLLKWTWEPPVVNCTLLYPSIVSDASGNKVPTCSPHPYVSIPLYQFGDLNNIALDFKACCGLTDRCKDLGAGSKSKCNGLESKGISLYTPLVAGEGNTTVRNLSCVWYYLEYVHCTWQPAEGIPANYSFHYWKKNRNTRYTGPAELKSFLDTGNHCQTYIINEDGVNVECLFQLQNSFGDRVELLFVVTGHSKNIKPFNLFKRANTIAKLRPPTIYNMSRISHQRLYISWNTLHVNESLESELAYSRLPNENEEIMKIIDDLKTEMINVLPEDSYTVKVRVKPIDYGLWSEWSKKEIITGVDNNRTISIIAQTIPIIILIIIVILCIYMKRIRILIFPQIPDPGKMLQADFQEWIKKGSSYQFSKPQKEEVCPVSILELPLTCAEAD